MRHIKHSRNIALALCLVLYVTLAYIYALIKAPWCDEVWSVIPAMNLAEHGFLGMGDVVTLILPTLNSEQYVYWYPPLSYWGMAGWFKIFGATLMSARFYSIFWGVVLLIGLYIIGNRYGKGVGVWAVIFTLLDYNFLFCSDARPDMMCAALALWGFLLMNAWFTAASCLVHPFAVMYVPMMALLKSPWGIKMKYRSPGASRMVFRWRLEWLPYLTAMMVWGVYIVQAPELWVSQFGVNVLIHTGQTIETKGLAVWMAYGVGWRLLLLTIYVGCTSIVAWKHRDIALWFLFAVLPAFLLTRCGLYFPHAVPVLALCVAIQMRKYPWLGLVALLELAFAITTLIPLWTWDGVAGLR